MPAPAGGGTVPGIGAPAWSCRSGGLSTSMLDAPGDAPVAAVAVWCAAAVWCVAARSINPGISRLG